jgi:hypothetical protein
MRQSAEALKERIQQLTMEEIAAVDQSVESLQLGEKHSMLQQGSARQFGWPIDKAHICSSRPPSNRSLRRLSKV